MMPISLECTQAYKALDLTVNDDGEVLENNLLEMRESLTLEIPEGVKCISDFAFAGCSSLRSIKIPPGVTRIADGAFDCCSGWDDKCCGCDDRRSAHHAKCYDRDGCFRKSILGACFLI